MRTILIFLLSLSAIALFGQTWNTSGTNIVLEGANLRRDGNLSSNHLNSITSPTIIYLRDTWAQYNSKLASINTLMRSGFNSYADALVDVAAESRLTDPQNTTYYFEGVHQNGAGRGIVGGLVSAVLQTI